MSSLSAAEWMAAHASELAEFELANNPLEVNEPTLRGDDGQPDPFAWINSVLSEAQDDLWDMVNNSDEAENTQEDWDFL